jgi:putative ABC transport system permease protein
MQLLAIVLLLIVCGNVGIMMLARTAARSGEITIRTALGASRLRIVSHVYVEALVLALLATTIGLLVAAWAAGRYTALATGQPYMDVSLGWGTMGVAFGLAFVCAGVAGVVPALKATGRGIQGNLRRSAGQGSIVRFGAGSTALIVAQVALSVGALSFGVAWTRTVAQDTTAELGIDLERYFSASLRISSDAAPSGIAAPDPVTFRNRVRATQMEVRRRIEAEPGVLSVALARSGDLPGERNPPRRIEVEGAPERSRTAVTGSVVDVSFFQDLERPILDGRGFRATDLPEEPGAHRPAVIVNTTFVEQVLGRRNPIGQRIRYAGSESNPWYEIVGVVGPLGTNPVNPGLDAGVYHPARPEAMNPLGLVIETATDPAEFTVRLRSIAAEVDPTAIIERPMRLSDLAELQAVGLKYLAIAPLALSGVAILLSAAGLCALMSFTVAQRRREIGLRKALGALPGSIVAAIGRRAFAPLLVGIVVGATLAVPLLQNLAQNPLVKPQNMWFVVLGVVLGTLLVGLLACVAPTLRGLRIQPMEALKEE